MTNQQLRKIASSQQITKRAGKRNASRNNIIKGTNSKIINRDLKNRQKFKNKRIKCLRIER